MESQSSIGISFHRLQLNRQINYWKTIFGAIPISCWTSNVCKGAIHKLRTLDTKNCRPFPSLGLQNVCKKILKCMKRHFASNAFTLASYVCNMLNSNLWAMRNHEQNSSSKTELNFDGTFYSFSPKLIYNGWIYCRKYCSNKIDKMA